MDSFLRLSDAQRLQLLRSAGEDLGVAPEAVEKDFWVCWVLRELFALPVLAHHLSFKGGTSLSKCWKSISRFSEDIDLVIDRGSFGIAGDLAPEAAASNSERKRRVKHVREACACFVLGRVRSDLNAQIGSRLPSELLWNLTKDEAEPDEPTLLFQYPRLAGEGGYLRREVRIELGARSDTEPSATCSVQPFVADAAGLVIHGANFEVRAVAPERTFWEKVLCLHEETHRKTPLGRRLSRHFYDIVQLQHSGVAARAIADGVLGARVASHRRLYFPKNQQMQGAMHPGTLRLVPLPEDMKVWRSDFETMRDSMFIGNAPRFDDLMTAVAALEIAVNASVWPHAASPA